MPIIYTFMGETRKTNYYYMGIAPSRNPHDPIYLQFLRIKTNEIVYRKALCWGKRT